MEKIVNELQFAYIRNEKDNKYTLFLKVDESFLNKDLDINLNNNQQLVIEDISNASGQSYITKQLPLEMFDSLVNTQTLTVFTNEEGKFLAEQLLEPLAPVIADKRKNKP